MAAVRAPAEPGVKVTVKVVLAAGASVVAPRLPTVKSALWVPSLEMESPVRLAVPTFFTVKVTGEAELPTLTEPQLMLALPSTKSMPRGCSTAISGALEGV